MRLTNQMTQYPHRRCVLADVDGSILDADGIIPEGLRELIQRTPQVHWVLATGRSHSSVLATGLMEIIRPDTPHIFDGGSTIATADGTLVRTQCLSQMERRSFLDNLENYEAEYIYAGHSLGGGTCWVSERAKPVSFPTRYCTSSFADFRDEVAARNITKFSMRGVHASSITPDLHSVSHSSIVDVLPAGVDKAVAAKYVLDLLGVSPLDAAFVFNDSNDLPVVTLPEFQAMTRIKVGPEISWALHDHNPARPEDVARVLTPYLAVV